MKRQRSELNLPELPYYGHGDLSLLYDRFKNPPPYPYRLQKNGESIEITLHHAGHVVGSISRCVKYQKKTVFFYR